MSFARLSRPNDGGHGDRRRRHNVERSASMMRHGLLFVLPVVAFLLVTGFALAADDKANTHTGTFVSAKSDTEFVMEDKGKQHTHMLAANAQVLGADGKACKLSDIQAGQKIRVTTKEGDIKTATKVEVLKDK
jgi:hypothetical protein